MASVLPVAIITTQFINKESFKPNLESRLVERMSAP